MMRERLRIRSTSDHRPLRVLESVAPPDGTTKFVDQVVRFAPADVHFTYFSWPQALLGRYDVFHVHWPEFLMRGRNQAVRLVRTCLTALLLVRLRATATPIVRTLHNVAPHKAGDTIERALLGSIDRSTALFVTLSEATPIPTGAPSKIVRHGHYKAVLTDDPALPRPGRMIAFGRIEPYKNNGELIRAFCSLGDQSAELRIVGKASKDMEDELRRAAGDDRRVSFHFGFVSDSQMVHEITSSQLVVLPYTEMHNSGVVLVALSLDRPVLVPRSPTNELLAREVGEEWLHLYDGPLHSRHLVEALNAAGRNVNTRPKLDDRDWSAVANGYADAFRAAVYGRTATHKARSRIRAR
jgi:beta-1,4-mannosyltransferase